MKESIVRKLFLWFGAVLVISMVIVVVAVRNSLKSVESSDWVNHTHAVILEVDGILSSLHAAMAAQRNHLITQDARDKAACEAALAETEEHLEVAKALSKDNERQRTRLAELERLISRRIGLARETTTVMETLGQEAARQKLLLDAGREAMREIRDGVVKLKSEENALLQQRDRAFNASARVTRWTLFGGLGLNFLLLGWVFWLIREDLSLRQKAARILEEANATLEAKVRERTAELRESNEALQIENLERQWAHAALGRLNEHNEMIINSIKEGVFVVSSGGNILRVNSAGARLLGAQPQELTGRPLKPYLRSTLHEPDLSWKADPIYRAMSEGRDIERAEGELVRKDGRVLPVHFNTRSLSDSGRVVAAVVGVMPAVQTIRS